MKKESQSDNLNLYNRFRTVPKEALKQFNNGRFSGSDINPMWRIKALTEAFGPCGKGWYFGEPKFTSETDGTTKTIHCTVALYWKQEDGSWSAPVYGVGGNTIASTKRDGSIMVTDEAYKMAYTDACGIAAKQLGVGADVWFEKDVTKYTQQVQAQPQQTQPQQTQSPVQRQSVKSQIPSLTDEQKAAAVSLYFRYNEAARKFYSDKGISTSEIFENLLQHNRVDAIGNIVDANILKLIDEETKNNIQEATIVVMDESTLLAQSNTKALKEEVKVVCDFFNNPINAQHIPFYEKMIGNKLGECIPNQCHLLYSTLKSNKLIA